MIKQKCLFVPVVAFLLFMGCNPSASKFNYPVTAKVDTVDTYFGHKVADPYRWLEDDQSAQTKEWVQQQNNVTFGYLNSISFRDSIRQRLTKIWNYPRQSAPWKSGNRYFFTKNDGLQNQSVIYMMDKIGDEPVMVLDPNVLSTDGTVALTTFKVSDDGKYLGYGISRGGSDWNEFFVRDLSSGKDLTDHLKWIKFSGLSWHKDGFFYNRYPQPREGDELKGTNSNSRIYFHKLGTSQDKDVLVYEDVDNPNRGFLCDVTDDGQLLIIYPSESTSGNSLYFKRLDIINAPVVKVVDDFNSDYSVVAHINGNLYVHTNYMAPNYQLVEIDTKNPARENWKVIVGQSDYDVLAGVSAVGGRFIGNYMHDAYSVVKVFDLAGKYLHDVKLPSLGSAGGFNGKVEDQETFYSFSSYTYPSVVYRYDVVSNQSQEYYRTPVDFDFGGYDVNQVFYTSKDGTKVPMFIVSKKGVQLDGNNPVWLYGYGGFNVSLNPGFDVRRLVWLENGGIYVVANIRGGGEYGEKWHKAGTQLNKQNVFDDFIAAARYLVDNKYTNPGKIAIQGGSNGGLLIGAVINQAPDLFRVALPAVGVMDMLRYHKFTIGRFWAADYGTSDDSEEMFQYLKAYSPLHSISSKAAYPAVLVTTADHDDRVVPAHSFKYIAQLQANYRGSNPVMIRIESQAGHGAGMPTSKMIDEWTDLYSFTFDQMGINPYSNK